MKHSPSSFHLKLDLLFAQRDAVTPDAVAAAGECAALEGLPVESPLIALLDSGLPWKRPRLRWEYERAYWAHCPANNPADFFRLDATGPWGIVHSRGVAGAKGRLRLHRDDVGDFFRCARNGDLRDYERWALDPYPVGGRTVLMRMKSFYEPYEDREHQLPADEEGTLCIDPDTHPSSGALYFGDPRQELRQLGALCKLETVLHAMLAKQVPTSAERQAAERRAARINAVAGVSFMPHTGFCYRCNADVTKALASITPGHAITGCPICAVSWCE